MSEVYTGEERRRDQTVQMEAIEAIVERLMTRIITEHAKEEKEMLNAALKSAFPEGNAEAHCEYHQSKIDAAKAEELFWTTIKVRLAETGIVGTVKLLGWLTIIGLATVIASRLGFLPAFITWLGGK